VYAEVALPLSRYRTFTYAVPAALGSTLRAGSFVPVPFRNRSAIGVVTALNEQSSFSGTIKEIEALRGGIPELPADLWSTLEWISDYYMTPLGMVLKTALPLGFSSRESSRSRSNTAITDAGREALADWGRRAPVQKTILERLAVEDAPLPVAALEALAASASAACRRLAEMGLVTLSYQLQDFDPLRVISKGSPREVRLTDEQAEALAVLKSGLQKAEFTPTLLKGVTSSGKTEVYLQAAREALAADRTVLVLVPEIALTPQVAARFYNAFGAEVALWHSRLTRAEKVWTWRQLHEGRFKVVVGARSAVFAPLQNLGLIIVDEEQEGSYKQEDPAPRYHARDVALIRGREAKAVVVLTSATPSTESYFNGISGRYRTLKLSHRYGGAAYPQVRLIDLRVERQRKDDYSLILSEPLVDAIGLRLERKEQVILLQNRRGFAPVCACNDCDYVSECPNCSVPLTYHKQMGQLRCHYCDHHTPGLEACPDCGSPHIFVHGVGTQKVEEEVARLFPDARLRRMDADTMRSRRAHSDILADFEAGKFDILLGTQMIAKGLDFEHVTLVGVVNADTGLAFPDFRAGERTFQLVYQVCGRAGRRKELPGEAIIQTFHPDDMAIKAAARLDAHRFYNQVLAERREFGYPPFVRLLRLLLQGQDRESVWGRAVEVKERLKAPPRGIRLLGPATAPFERLRGQWRIHLLIRSDRERDPGGGRLRHFLRSHLPQSWLEGEHKGVRIKIDMDPVNLL